MTRYYRDYVWKEGLPYGISATGESLPEKGVAYKIASDPYHKHVTIEKYCDTTFDRIVYDSALFNFRHLRPNQQRAWEKRTVIDTPEKTVCHLFDQDDHFIIIEEYCFENGLCRQCRATTPHGFFLSTQKIFYEALGDDFNGVALYDSEGKIVMSKHYEIDPTTLQFTKLLSEY